MPNKNIKELKELLECAKSIIEGNIEDKKEQELNSAEESRWLTRYASLQLPTENEDCKEPIKSFALEGVITEQHAKDIEEILENNFKKRLLEVLPEIEARDDILEDLDYVTGFNTCRKQILSKAEIIE